MAIDWVTRMAALNAADLHIQVALQNIPRNFDQSYGTIHVSGKVVRIFKARKPLEIHSVVAFDLPVVVREKCEFPDGGMICWYEDLFLHPYFEVCLNGSPPLCTLALDLHQIVSEPTEVPVINFEQESKIEQEAMKWWKFW